MLPTDESFMHRCLYLARQGAGHVAPNPMVGAVLVHNGIIIGEGYHQEYGKAHAEVNCIASVAGKDVPLIPSSTLYVSLEPCAHFGKTPPCSDLIIHHRIPKVVIGCRDPFPEVNGKGVEKLKKAGVEVVTGVLEHDCIALNKRFFTSVVQKRPYIILKWAQTADGKISGGTGQRLLITGERANRIVHQWRSEEAAILVGTNTALLDDPSLTNRLWSGKNPTRLVLDLSLRLPHHLRLFDRSVKTIVFNSTTNKENGDLIYQKIDASNHMVNEIVKAAHQHRLQSLLVEGGTKLLQSFIDAGLWDEARIITNPSLHAGQGLPAPLLQHAEMTKEENAGTDVVKYFVRTSAQANP
ncbi:bifunctional diaminohydroxyphosphoribosylaminopyrimidine deaminase/5-amino-6-(5-phosphoribosylamino)uracil reductase RibD [Sediminibacterium roseum]|nr:bifunctional diaminohydroxyphosphoribosylaminopyrimidine deaminase/5-amino-6-(5-phosphoribosylamino)uracil reductase RibD [Sediminibacterium roseum]